MSVHRKATPQSDRANGYSTLKQLSDYFKIVRPTPRQIIIINVLVSQVILLDCD